MTTNNKYISLLKEDMAAFYKKRKNTITIVAVIAVTLLMGVLIFMFYVRRNKDVFKDDAIVQADLDSLKKQAVIDHKQVVYLLKRAETDSIYLSKVKDQLEGLPDVLNNLNNQYNAKRNAYSALPVDKRFLLFAGFISEIDTTSK